MVKFGKKKVAVAAVILVLVLAAAVTALVLFGGKTAKTVQVTVDRNYSEVLKKDNPSAEEIDKALKAYAKEQTSEETVYTKGDETVRVRTDADGNVNYISYNRELGENEQVKLSKFNESMIKIGQSEEEVLSLLSNDNYIYNVKTVNDAGKPLHIFYYGWNNNQAILELVFTDAKLTYYTINSQDLATKSQAPDVDDIK